jgi:hypothetical protein
MDAQKFLSSFIDRSYVLSHLTDLLYATCGGTDSAPCATFALKGEPEARIERFENIQQRDLWWDELVSMMTKSCKPPCIVCGSMLFQPHYLLRIVPYSDARAHFVVLDFGNKRNIWLGYKEAHVQVALLQELAVILKPNFNLRSNIPPTQ